MRAVAIQRFGGPEVLQVIELPTPQAGAGEVRIQVHAATVNPVDILIRTGRSAVRLRHGTPLIPGLDVAGVVDQIGPGTLTDLAPGDRVMAMVNPTRPAGGGYAEWVVLPATYVAPTPEGTTHAEAATVPTNGLTALHAIDQLTLADGASVGVTGGAGAVGGFAVQMAAANGLQVIADAADHDAALMHELGASAVVARGPDTGHRMRDVVPFGVDALVDAAGLGIDVLAAVRDHGQFAVVRQTDPQLAPAAARRAISVISVFVHDYDGRLDKLVELQQLVEVGALTLRVADVLPPQQVGRAHDLLEHGGVRGRLVIGFHGAEGR